MDTKQLKHKILDLAIRGKLVPQDPNDEPASVLLERIRAEKEQLIAQGKLKKSKSKISDKPHYENVPFEIPESWEWCRLDDIAQSNIGLTYSPSEVCNDGVPVLRSCNIKNQKLCWDELVRVKSNILDKQYLQEGDLLICARNGSRHLVGKCALINNIQEPISFGAFMAVCRSKYNQWIYYLLHTTYFDRYLDDSNSTTINQVTQKMLLDFQIPMPPILEQEHIITEIQKWFELINDLESNKKDLKEYIKQVKSKVLSLAISGKLVPQDPNDEPAIELLKRINPNFKPCDTSHYENLPAGWTVSTIGEVAQYINGRAFKPTEWEKEGIPIIRIQNLNDPNAPYNYSTVNYEDKYLIKDGDLLFAWAASLGAYIWNGSLGWLNQHIFKVEPKEFMNKQYLYYSFMNLIADFYRQSHGSGMVHITKGKFESTPILIPPLDEQERINITLENIFNILDNISAES